MKVKRCWRSVVCDVEILELCQAALLALRPVPRVYGEVSGSGFFLTTMLILGYYACFWAPLHDLTSPILLFFKAWFLIGTASWGRLSGRRGWHWCRASCPSWGGRGLRTRLVWFPPGGKFCRCTRPPCSLPSQAGWSSASGGSTPPQHMGGASSWPFSGPWVGSAAAGTGHHSGVASVGRCTTTSAAPRACPDVGPGPCHSRWTCWSLLFLLLHSSHLSGCSHLAFWDELSLGNLGLIDWLPRLASHQDPRDAPDCLPSPRLHVCTTALHLYILGLNSAHRLVWWALQWLNYILSKGVSFFEFFMYCK